MNPYDERVVPLLGAFVACGWDIPELSKGTEPYPTFEVRGASGPWWVELFASEPLTSAAIGRDDQEATVEGVEELVAFVEASEERREQLWGQAAAE
ncbi:hypothetical protein ACWDTT_15795 [Streptosporangium sandarakinum]